MKKNTVTKMLAVAVTIAMLGGLTACGSSSKEPASGSAAATGEATQAEAEEGTAGDAAGTDEAAADSGVVIPHLRTVWPLMWLRLWEEEKRTDCEAIL